MAALYCEGSLSSSLGPCSLAGLGHEEILLSLLLCVGGTTSSFVGFEFLTTIQNLLKFLGLGLAFSLGLRHDHVGIESSLDLDHVLFIVRIKVRIAQIVEFLALGNGSFSAGSLSWIPAGTFFPFYQLSHLGKIGSSKDTRGGDLQ